MNFGFIFNRYDGCPRGKSKNFFDDEWTCKELCTFGLSRKFGEFTAGFMITIKLFSSIKLFSVENELNSFEFFRKVSEKRYLSSGTIQIDHTQCTGFHYNLTKPFAWIESFLCLIEEGGTCSKQVLNTNMEYSIMAICSRLIIVSIELWYISSFQAYPSWGEESLLRCATMASRQTFLRLVFYLGQQSNGTVWGPDRPRHLGAIKIHVGNRNDLNTLLILGKSSHG